MSSIFNPQNKIIRLCMLGMNLIEEQGDFEEGMDTLKKALSESENDFDRFIVTYKTAKYEKESSIKLRLLEECKQYIIKSDDYGVKSTFSTIYLDIARCYEELGDLEKAKANYELSDLYNTNPCDEGPFYHGTKVDLPIGDFLIAGKNSNYKSGIKMNHIYFTSNINGAVLAASLSKGEGKEHIYIVEPTGVFENDPNVTDKKFPGNLTCSYRSEYPLKIIGEKTDYTRQENEDIVKWRKKIANNNGKIIN